MLTQSNIRGDGIKYLFRAAEESAFITSGDPKYEYIYVCGECGYPVLLCNKRCPRCRKELDPCPVCSHRSRKIPCRQRPKGDQDSVQCSVCQMRRLPRQRRLRMQDVNGNFCSNLYGCSAGGMILRTGEICLLPPRHDLCPVCHSAERYPLDIGVFEHAMKDCMFCGHIFRDLDIQASEPMEGFDRKTQINVQVEAEYSRKPDRRCLICERADYYDEKDKLVKRMGEVGEQAITTDDYRHVLELGRAFALSEDDNEVFTEIYTLWFRRTRDTGQPTRDALPVGHTAMFLLRGTVEGPTKRILERRLDAFTMLWASRVPAGMSFVP